MKRLGGTGLGFLYRMEIPRFMNWRVKSTALSRSAVTVKSAMANSAFYKIDNDNIFVTIFLVMVTPVTMAPMRPFHSFVVKL